jgi:hypothetical protein
MIIGVNKMKKEILKIIVLGSKIKSLFIMKIILFNHTQKSRIINFYYITYKILNSIKFNFNILLVKENYLIFLNEVLK